MRGRKKRGTRAGPKAGGDGVRQQQQESQSPPDIPLWFKVGFWVQFSLNIVFLVVAVIAIAKIGEFWAVDSRNLWREIDRLSARIEEQHGDSEITSLNTTAAQESAADSRAETQAQGEE